LDKYRGIKNSFTGDLHPPACSKTIYPAAAIVLQVSNAALSSAMTNFPMPAGSVSFWRERRERT
jgi:hypothetical protein